MSTTFFGHFHIYKNNTVPTLGPVLGGFPGWVRVVSYTVETVFSVATRICKKKHRSDQVPEGLETNNCKKSQISQKITCFFALLGH